MDYNLKSTFLFFGALNLVTYLSITNYVEKTKLELIKEKENNKLLEKLLFSKILKLEKRIEKLDDFNLKLLEKKIIYGQNRDWDSHSSDEFTDVD